MMLHLEVDESRWNERVGRALALAAIRPAAAEALTFYAAVAEYQKALVRGGRPLGAGPPRPIIDALQLGAVLDAIPDFLAWLARVAPARLAESAVGLRTLERDQWLRLIHSSLADEGRDLGEDHHALTFVVEAVLQPFAEQAALAEPAEPAEPAGQRRHPPQSNACCPIRCPFCNALPVVGVLREEGHGARRSLVCSLCLIEQPYLRGVCPSCGEQQFDALPVYTADEFEHVRIEACDHCHRYLKTIDLTRDGLAIPLVDDIASVSLDLWARDRGYVRLRANLLGL
jgi:formate dehydrogenase accessory protein FdhE